MPSNTHRNKRQPPSERQALAILCLTDELPHLEVLIVSGHQYIAMVQALTTSISHQLALLALTNRHQRLTCALSADSIAWTWLSVNLLGPRKRSLPAPSI